jgi:hypothetical protein
MLVLAFGECQVRISSAHTLQNLPLLSRNGLATPNNGKHHAWRARLNVQPQQFLEVVPQLVEHRHAKPVRLPGSTPIL